MDSSEGEYWITNAIPQTDIDSLNAGTNLLLLSKGTEDMRSVAEDIIAMAPNDDEGAVWISLDGDVEWIIEDFADSSDMLKNLSIIEVGDESEQIEELDPDHYFTVKSPKQLTDLGMALIEYEDILGSSFSGNRIVFDSITTLLANVEEDRVFEFIAAFSGRIRVDKNLGIWLMNTGEHGEETIPVFRELFDIVIELPDEGATEEVKIEVDAGDTGDWVSK